MSCDHPAGHPDCSDRDCRTRWLAGTTTGEPYKPAPLASLLVDILETWDSWFTERQLWDQVQRIRPEIDLQVFRKEGWRVRQRCGAWVAGQWVPVECRVYQADPFSTSTDEPNWMLHAR